VKFRLALYLLSIVGFALLAGCRTGQALGNGGAAPRSASDQPEEPIRLTIVATNDVHGHVFPRVGKLRDGSQLEEGGSAILAGYLANARADNPDGVLLLDGGDLFQGTLATNLTEGAVMVDAYNYLGYQAVAIGNHEFDYGPVGPKVLATAPGEDPLGALKARIQQAKFPFLSANLYEAGSANRPSWLGNDGTTVVEIKGLKVGIVGLSTPTTPKTTLSDNVAALRFGSLAPEALSASKSLRRHGADLVIAIAHAGGKCKPGDPHDLSSCDTRDAELFEMLEELPPKTLDAAVGGHTHQFVGHFVNGTPAIETWGLGNTFGVIELFVDPKLKTVLTDKTVIRAGIPVCTRVDSRGACDVKKAKDLEPNQLVQASFAGRPVVPDQKLAELLEPVRQKILPEETRSLGVKVAQPLERNHDAESPLGSILTDSLREMEGADIALMNPGGIRANLPAGELTYGAVYEVMPFENTVATLTVSGEEVSAILRAAYNARRGVYQVSGATVSLAACPGEGRFKGALLANGKPIVPGKQYKVVMPDFIARGGDGMAPAVASIAPSRIDFGTRRELNIRDAIASFWQKRKRELLAPKLGRVKMLPDAGSCPNPTS
jgi:5'-nucleotidase